jgi:aspartate kinase
VVGIAGSDGFCSLFVEKYLMNRQVGFGRHLLRIIQDEGLSFEHAPSGIDSLSVIIRDKKMSPELEKRLMERIQTELRPDNLSMEHGLALIMIVGEGMHLAIGMAARATRALAQAGVNLEMINQGSSEISMMFGIQSRDLEAAVKGLYKEFFK